MTTMTETKGASLTADHQCLRNSILNLIRMVPASEEEVQQLDDMLCAVIAQAENGDVHNP
jgi:hypothetical protein